MQLSKQCKQCGKTFFKPKTSSKKVWENAKYCSRQCVAISNIGNKPPKTAFANGHVPWNKGKHHSPETIDKLLIVNKLNKRVGSDHHYWKGENASYAAVHMWIKRFKRKPDNCELCGKYGNSYQIHWSNIDHKYKRNLDDYIALCASCHKKYDLQNGLCLH